MNFEEIEIEIENCGNPKMEKNTDNGTVEYGPLTGYLPPEELMSMNAKQLKEVFSKIDRKVLIEASEKQMEEMQKKKLGRPRQYFMGCEGEIDFSGAILLHIDGPTLKLNNFPLFNFLVDFQFVCMCNDGLHRFAPPDTPSTSRFTSFAGSSLFGVLKKGWKKYQKSGSFKDTCRKHAIGALDVYNRNIKEPKLKFERLVAANNEIWHAKLVYVTFSAMDLHTGTSDIYQAAVMEFKGDYYLGLLREYSTRKILAILSLTGAEEEIAAKRAYHADLAQR